MVWRFFIGVFDLVLICKKGLANVGARESSYYQIMTNMQGA